MSSENVVQFSEGAFSPDDESSDMSSGGELEEIESADVNSLNTGDVSQGSDKRNVLSTVDNKWSSSGSVSSVSEFTETSSNLDGVGNFLDIIESSDISKESDGFFSSFNSFDCIVNDEWEFWNLVESVSSCLDKWEDS